MPASPILCVRPVTAELREAVLRVRVSPAQDAFVRPPAATLARAAGCAGSQPMAILCDGTVIGYYCIESSARTLTERDADADAPGLRSFQIDAAWQGRGLAHPAVAALLEDTAQRHPAARRLVLTVNVDNAVALGLYLRHGFVGTGELYHGGRSGPQHVLWRSLP